MSSCFEAQERLISLMERRQCRPIVVASHPRSGTHLMIDALRLNFAACRSWKLSGEVPTCLFVDLDRAAMQKRGLGYWAVSRPIWRGTKAPVVKTHVDGNFDHIIWRDNSAKYSPKLIAWLKTHATFIYMHRDVRESLASAYFGAPQYHVGQSFAEYIFEPADCHPSRLLAWAAHVRSWVSKPDVIGLSMECLKSRPSEVFRSLSQKLQLPLAYAEPRLPRPRTFPIGFRIRRALAFNVESTALFDPKVLRQTHNWRTAVNRKDCDRINEQVGDLLVQLGYESSADWVDNMFSNVEAGSDSSGRNKDEKQIHVERCST